MLTASLKPSVCLCLFTFFLKLNKKKKQCCCNNPVSFGGLHCVVLTVW